MAMPPLLVLVGGPPASGKTTLAALLAAEFRLPVFSKDFFKETLFDTLGAPTRERSRELSAVAYQLLYRSTAQLLHAGLGVVLESNFVRRRSEAELQPLVERSRAVLIHCRVPRDVIARRYRQRVIAGERHPGHHDAVALPGVLAGFDAGLYEPLQLAIPTLTVDSVNGYTPELTATIQFIETATAT